MLTAKEVIEAFVNVQLEEDYNFLESDLVKLANAIIAKAKPQIEAEERAKCIEVARAYNTLVADKIEEVRGK
jgi:tellurite resistance protein